MGRFGLWGVIILVMVPLSLEGLYLFLNPKMNQKGLGIQDCLSQSKNSEPYFMKSWDRKQTLSIYFIRRSPNICIAPKFPLIQISYSDAIGGWLHLVYTFSHNGHEQNAFVDSGVPLNPFYTQDPIFSDSPFWNSLFFVKPLYRWEGHVYAVKQHHHRIEAVGGIRWGFVFPILGFGPKEMRPEALSQTIWLTQDQPVFVKHFPDVEFK